MGDLPAAIGDFREAGLVRNHHSQRAVRLARFGALVVDLGEPGRACRRPRRLWTVRCVIAMGDGLARAVGKRGEAALQAWRHGGEAAASHRRLGDVLRPDREPPAWLKGFALSSSSGRGCGPAFPVCCSPSCRGSRRAASNRVGDFQAASSLRWRAPLVVQLVFDRRSIRAEREGGEPAHGEI